MITGWRMHSEVLPLEWSRVDFDAGTVSLARGTTKSGEPRVFVMTTDLRTLLEDRWREHERVKRQGHIVPWVFFRKVKRRDQDDEPRPAKSISKAWRSACRAAGLPGRIPHDLRRSAVRTFVRAGLGEHVAMALSGHKTASVFRRYDIVATQDLQAAAVRLDEGSARKKERRG